MPTRDFRPGFRLSALDVIVLLISGVTSAYVATFDGWLGIAIAFVVLHFFLFCNVLRMARRFELIWAAVFAALAVTVAAGLVAWSYALAVCLLLTVFFSIIQIGRPSYHGLGWRRLNPELIQWWQSSVATGAHR